MITISFQNSKIDLKHDIIITSLKIKGIECREGKISPFFNNFYCANQHMNNTFKY